MSKPKKDKRTSLEKEKDEIYDQMSKINDKTSQEYAELQKSLKNLTDVEVALKEASTNGRVWIDVLKVTMPAISSIGGILLILNYEKLGVVSSKALSFVLRGRA